MQPSDDQPHCCVLVVEDEPFLLMDVVDHIEDAGISTYSARNADEALRLLDRHSDIGVLFTDVDMPGSMDGLELARRVHEIRPSVAIMVTSGHVRITEKDLPDNGRFFAKPYLPKMVVKAFCDVLASRAA